jgi:hypothetical protein
MHPYRGKSATATCGRDTVMNKTSLPFWLPRRLVHLSVPLIGIPTDEILIVRFLYNAAYRQEPPMTVIPLPAQIL